MNTKWFSKILNWVEDKIGLELIIAASFSPLINSSVGSGQWVVAGHSPLATPHWPLPTPHRPLPTPHWDRVRFGFRDRVRFGFRERVRATTHPPLPTPHCPLATAHSPLPTAHSRKKEAAIIYSSRIHLPNLNKFWTRVLEIFTSPGQVRILLHY